MSEQVNALPEDEDDMLPLPYDLCKLHIISNLMICICREHNLPGYKQLCIKLPH